MNLEQLRSKSRELDRILRNYEAADPEVKNLRTSIDELLRKALAGDITSPLARRDVPGAYFFLEGSLRKYPDLEKAYWHFKIEVTGGPSETLQKLLSDPDF